MCLNKIKLDINISPCAFPGFANINYCISGVYASEYIWTFCNHNNRQLLSNCCVIFFGESYMKFIVTESATCFNVRDWSAHQPQRIKLISDMIH